MLMKQFLAYSKAKTRISLGIPGEGSPGLKQTQLQEHVEVDLMHIGPLV